MKKIASIWRKRAAQPVLSVFFGLVLVLQTAVPIAALAQDAPSGDSAPQEQTLVEEENKGEEQSSARFFNQNHETQICHKTGQDEYEEITLSSFTSIGLIAKVILHKLHGDIHPVPQNGCPAFGNLTLIKEVVGGQASSESWTLTADGEGQDSDLSGTTPVSGKVAVGNYTLGESGPEGYTPSNWVCIITSDDDDEEDDKIASDSLAPMDGNIVTVGKGQNITCTITNTFNTPEPEIPNLHFIKVVCDQYSDIVGNDSASVEDDTNGNYTQFKDGVVTKPVGTAEIPGQEAGCYRANGWSFLLSTDIGQQSNIQTVGPTTGGEYVTPVTGEDSVLNEALQSGIENGAFWVSEVEKDGYGFASLRCYNDALNGDNLEFVNLGEINENTPSNIYCIAYNIQSVPDTEPCGTELIANGSFETPVIEGGWDIVNNGTSGLGWSVEWMPSIPVGAPNPASVELHHGVNGWAPQEGQQYAELDGDWGGPSSGQSGEDGSSKIYQTLSTVPGSEYTISYWTSPRPGIADNQVRFSWNGSPVETIVEDGSANGQTVWTQHTHTLTATGSTTVIEFADLSAGDSLGSFIDNVSVKEVCPVDPCNLEQEHPTKGIFAAITHFIDEAISPNDESDCTSTISGMKYNDLNGNGVKDEGEPGLAGWDIYAYKGIPASNITVDSANINGSDTNWVAPGQYLVMARGTWNNGGSQYFDTEFHTPDSWATHEDGVVPYGTDIGDIVINDTNFVNWGVYNNQNENGFEHYYFYILNHPGGNINYSVFDGTGGVKNAGWYGDNTGSINVQMYPLLDTAVTDANGNYTLEFPTTTEFPVVVREVQQNGWTQTSPNASTGPAATPTSDGVNYPITGNWNWAFVPGSRDVTGSDFGNHFVGQEQEPCEEVSQVVSLFSSASTKTAGYTTTVLASDSDGLNATNYSGAGLFTGAVELVSHPAWIDPTVNGSFSGSGAKWISTNVIHPGAEGGDGQGNENQWRLFQTKFTIPAGATVTPGTLYFSADNAVSVYLNGIKIDDTSEDLVTYGPNVVIPEVFKNVYSVALTPVAGQENVLEFVVRNSAIGQVENPTGLLYNGSFSYTPDCTPPSGGGGGSNGGGGGSGDGGSRSSGGGGGGTPTPQQPDVLGDSTTIPSDPIPQILGASTELPRTGIPAQVLIALLGLATLPLLAGRKTQLEK